MFYISSRQLSEDFNGEDKKLFVLRYSATATRMYCNQAGIPNTVFETLDYLFETWQKLWNKNGHRKDKKDKNFET